MGDLKVSHTFKDVLSSRHNLNELLEKRLDPQSLVYVNRVMKILLAGLIVLGFVEFFTVLGTMNSVKNSTKLVQTENLRLSETQAIINNVRQLVF